MENKDGSKPERKARRAPGDAARGGRRPTGAADGKFAPRGERRSTSRDASARGESKEFGGKRPERGSKPAARRGGDFERGQKREGRPQAGVRIERGERPRIDFPPLPENVLAEDLHISVRAQLKTLSQENQEFVARHLQMVALMIDDDPQLAFRHALAASKKAGRIAVVRETLGVAAYTIGDYALALRELLTHRRISGSNDQLPLIVDCERGLGRPERGIEAATGVDRSKLEVGVRINLAIALSGARLDLGQLKAAQQELEIRELGPAKVYEQSPLLFRSYAEVLREAGKDGSEWDRLADRAEQALAAKDGEVFELIEELQLPPAREKNANRRV